MTCKRTRYKDRVDELQRVKSRIKSSVRSKVECPFRILKLIFRFDEVCYPDLGKSPPPVCLQRADNPLPTSQAPTRPRVHLPLQLLLTVSVDRKACISSKAS